MHERKEKIKFELVIYLCSTMDYVKKEKVSKIIDDARKSSIAFNTLVACICGALFFATLIYIHIHIHMYIYIHNQVIIIPLIILTGNQFNLSQFAPSRFHNIQGLIWAAQIFSTSQNNALSCSE